MIFLCESCQQFLICFYQHYITFLNRKWKYLPHPLSLSLSLCVSLAYIYSRTFLFSLSSPIRDFSFSLFISLIINTSLFFFNSLATFPFFLVLSFLGQHQFRSFFFLPLCNALFLFYYTLFSFQLLFLN